MLRHEILTLLWQLCVILHIFSLQSRSETGEESNEEQVITRDVRSGQQMRSVFQTNVKHKPDPSSSDFVQNRVHDSDTVKTNPKEVQEKYRQLSDQEMKNLFFDQTEFEDVLSSLNLQTHTQTFDTESKRQKSVSEIDTSFQLVPLTFATIERLLQPLLQANAYVMRDQMHIAQDIWKRVNQTYNKHSHPRLPTVQTKLIILEQIETVIVQYFNATARTDKEENFMLSPYSKEYLMAAVHIDFFIYESDMFGDRMTNDIRTSFIGYYLFFQYASKIGSRITPLPPRYEAMYLTVVSSETRWLSPTVYTSKQSIKRSVDDFVSFGMAFHTYPQFFVFASDSALFTSNFEVCEVCEAWWKRELQINRDLISVDWKTLDYVQKALQAVEDVHLQQNVETRQNHYTSKIIKNTNIYSIHESFSEHIVDQYNDFSFYVDFELLKRQHTYPIELSIWRKLVYTRKTTICHGILMREMDQSNANFLIDHLTIHVLFEHAKPYLQTITAIPYFDEHIAILDDILKVCDLEFNYPENFDTTSCDDLLQKTNEETVEMTIEVYRIMRDVESIANEIDLGSEKSITPYIRIVSFFVRKLLLLQASFSKKQIVQEAFTLLSTGKKQRLDAFKDVEKGDDCLEMLVPSSDGEN